MLISYFCCNFNNYLKKNTCKFTCAIIVQRPGIELSCRLWWFLLKTNWYGSHYKKKSFDYPLRILLILLNYIWLLYVCGVGQFSIYDFSIQLWVGYKNKTRMKFNIMRSYLRRTSVSTHNCERFDIFNKVIVWLWL